MALKLIDEEVLIKNQNDYIDKRDGWKKATPNYECYDLVVREYEKLKSKLLTLPDSSDQEQDELWNEVVAKVCAIELIIKIKPSDVDGINEFKKRKIEELKSKFTIQKK